MESDLQRERLQADRTCDNCAHTIRKSRRQDVVVCVPHLKMMPANNSLVCEFYAEKIKKVYASAGRSDNEGAR